MNVRRNCFGRVPGLIVVGLLTIGAALAIACGGGVSKAEYDATKSQLTQEQQKATTLQQQLSDKLREISDLERQVSSKEGDLGTLQKEITAKEQEAEELRQKMGDMADVTVLIGARPQPTATPRATPTPLPAGTTPPPPAVPEPAVVDEVLPFVFYVETLATGSVSKYGLASFPSCVPNSIFKRGSKLVWRFEVFDTSTGKRVTSLDANTTVKILLPHGEELTARYSKRGGTGPWMWAAGWDIPPDYPLGAFDYKIQVNKAGKAGTFVQPALVNADRGIDSRVQVID